MVRHCCVKGCKTDSRYHPGAKFYKFPASSKKTALRLQWILSVNRVLEDHTLWEPKINGSDAVCYKHFQEGKPTIKFPVPTLHMDVITPTASISGPNTGKGKGGTTKKKNASSKCKTSKKCKRGRPRKVTLRKTTRKSSPEGKKTATIKNVIQNNVQSSRTHMLNFPDCDHCVHGFKDNLQLVDHMCSHFMFYSSVEAKSLQKHNHPIAADHTKWSEVSRVHTTVSCNICSIIFPDEESCRNHIEHFHLETLGYPVNVNWQNEDLQYEEDALNYLDSDIQAVIKSGQVHDEKYKNYSLPIENDTAFVQLYTCPECGEDCASLEKLRYHTRHHGFLLCLPCGKHFKSASELFCHSCLNDEVYHPCHQCGLAVRTEEELRKHSLLHQPSFSLICERLTFKEYLCYEFLNIVSDEGYDGLVVRGNEDTSADNMENEKSLQISDPVETSIDKIVETEDACEMSALPTGTHNLSKVNGNNIQADKDEVANDIKAKLSENSEESAVNCNMETLFKEVNTCPVCFTLCIGTDTLNKHKSSCKEAISAGDVKSEAEKKFSCTICNCMYKTAQTRNKHMQQVHNLGPKLLCMKCYQSMSDSSIYLRHRDSHKSHSFPCTLCPESFGSMFHLNVHLVKSHSVMCDLCNLPYCPTREKTKRFGLENAVSKNECENCRIEKCTSLHFSQCLLNENAKSFICRPCSKSFRSQHDLQVHSESYCKGKKSSVGGTKESFVCCICDGILKCDEDLQNHLISVHKVQHVSTSNIASAGEAMRKSKNQKKTSLPQAFVAHPCHLCTIMFLSQEELDAHLLKVHSKGLKLKLVTTSTAVHTDRPTKVDVSVADVDASVKSEENVPKMRQKQIAKKEGPFNITLESLNQPARPVMFVQKAKMQSTVSKLDQRQTDKTGLLQMPIGIQEQDTCLQRAKINEKFVKIAPKPTIIPDVGADVVIISQVETDEHVMTVHRAEGHPDIAKTCQRQTSKKNEPESVVMCDQEDTESSDNDESMEEDSEDLSRQNMAQSLAKVHKNFDSRIIMCEDINAYKPPPADQVDFVLKNFHSYCQVDGARKVGKEAFHIPCRICGMALPTLGSLQVHLKQHRKSRAVVCKACNKRFQNINLFEEHVKEYPSHCFRCELCKKPFSCEADLKAHVAEGHEEPPEGKKFQKLANGKCLYRRTLCDICGKMITSATFRKHVSLHGIKYRCSKCEKYFSDVRLLEEHKPDCNATGELLCQQCPKTFKNSKLLKMHLRFHNDIRPYPCDGCGRAFHTKQNMRVHSKRYCKALKQM